jgi:hypothetical protein
LFAALLAVVVLGSVVWYLLPSEGDEDNLENPSVQATPVDPASSSQNGDEKGEAQQPPAKSVSAHVARLQQKAQEENRNVQELLKEMQELLDDNDDDGAFELAVTFSKSPSRELRSKALDAFRWVGGKQSVKACREMLSDDDAEISKEAMEAFRQSLESIDEEEGFSELYPMIKDVMMECKDENDLEALFLLLSNLHVRDSLNLYMDLQERGVKENREDIVDLTKEYIEFVTNGTEGIDSRTAMEKWLKQHEDE